MARPAQVHWTCRAPDQPALHQSRKTPASASRRAGNQRCLAQDRELLAQRRKAVRFARRYRSTDAAAAGQFLEDRQAQGMGQNPQGLLIHAEGSVHDHARRLRPGGEPARGIGAGKRVGLAETGRREHRIARRQPSESGTGRHVRRKAATMRSSISSTERPTARIPVHRTDNALGIDEIGQPEPTPHCASRPRPCQRPRDLEVRILDNRERHRNPKVIAQRPHPGEVTRLSTVDPMTPNWSAMWIG